MKYNGCPSCFPSCGLYSSRSLGKFGSFSVVGQPVRHLVDGPLAAGRYRFVWAGRDRDGRVVASGIYFYRLAADSFVAVGRLALMR